MMIKRSQLQGSLAAAAVAAGLALGSLTPTYARADTLSDLYGSTYDRMSVIEQQPDDSDGVADDFDYDGSAYLGYGDGLGDAGIMLLADSTPTVSPRALSGEMLYFCVWESGQNYDQGLSYGDGYHAMGYFQFDNRYDLGGFLQAVYNYNPGKYGTALKNIKSRYGWKVSGATYSDGALTQLGRDLNAAWHACYKADPTEFSNLQNGWAYDNYYVPAQTYMKSRGIPISGRSDSVKSLCWGMCNLFGTTGWHKFVGGWSDGYDWNHDYSYGRNWPGAGLTASMSDTQFVTTLCDYVVDNVATFYWKQPQYWNGWQSRYRAEKSHYLAVLAKGNSGGSQGGSGSTAQGKWSVTGVNVSPSSIKVGDKVSFSAKLSGSPSGATYNYVWRYGTDWKEWGSTVKDTGSNTTSTSGSFTPTKSGTYTLTVDVVDSSGKKQSARTTVTVGEAWEPVGVDAPAKVYVGKKVSFSAKLSGVADGATYNYVWRYGTDWKEWGSTVKDTGSKTSATTGSFTPTKTGTYTLTVDVKDRYGREKSMKTKVKVIADWKATGVDAPTVVKQGDRVTFSAKVVNGPVDEAEYNYVWRYGDGWKEWDSTVKSTGKNTTATSGSFVASKLGTYTVSVDVKDSLGRAKTVRKTITVTKSGWLATGVSAPATATSGTQVKITPQVSGTIKGAHYNYVWRCGDGWSFWNSTVKSTGTTTTANPGTFVPTKTGTYRLTVDVFDTYGNRQSVSTTMNVVAPNWKATGVNVSGTLKKGSKVTYSAQLTNRPAGLKYNYVWRYGDGWKEWGSTVKSTGSKTGATSGSFTPTKAGTYTLTIDIEDTTGRRSSVTKKITVK